MKAIKRTSPIVPNTVIEFNEAVALVTMMNGDWKLYRRSFDANLTFADADIQFKEWADNIDLAHNEDVMAIDIRIKNLKNSPVWTY